MNGLKRIGGILVLCSSIFFPAISEAQAETPQTNSQASGNPVEAKGVGISGGIIAGAEVVIAVQAMFGVDKLWPYLTFPILGAAGGGVGGYYLEKNAPPGGSVALLAGSLALVIPTAILATSAMAYDPDEEGSLEDDRGGGAGFSFETPPTSGPEDGQSTTEIETSPEGAPEDTVAPPPEGGPPAPAPEEEPAEPDEAPPAEAEPEESAPSDVSSHRRDNRAHEERMARIRRATAGALLFVDNDGTTALAMPFIGIRPTAIADQGSQLITKQGVELMVPLLRIDLP